MDPRIKSLLIIFITLAIGFGAGFVTSGWLVRQRFQSMRKMIENKEDFQQHLARVAEATPEQMEAIAPILEEYHEEMRFAQREMFQEMRQRSDSLREKLRPFLSDDQIEKVVQEMRWRRPRGKGRQGPPRPGE